MFWCVLTTRYAVLWLKLILSNLLWRRVVTYDDLLGTELSSRRGTKCYEVRDYEPTWSFEMLRPIPNRFGLDSSCDTQRDEKHCSDDEQRRALVCITTNWDEVTLRNVVLSDDLY